MVILQADRKTEKTTSAHKKHDVWLYLFPVFLFLCGVTAGVAGIFHENSNFISFGFCSMFWGILLLLHSIENVKLITVLPVNLNIVWYYEP